MHVSTYFLDIQVLSLRILKANFDIDKAAFPTWLLYEIPIDVDSLHTTIRFLYLLRKEIVHWMQCNVEALKAQVVPGLEIYLV